MAKRKKIPDAHEQSLQNPVAKYMNRFNKAHIHGDKKSHYQRRRKHKHAEPFPMAVLQPLETAPA